LGDIIFLQKVCKTFIAKGYKIIYPVVFEYEWLNDYIPDVNFISWSDKNNKLTHKDKLPENVNFPYKDKYNPFSPHFFSEDFVFLNFFQNPIGRVMEFKYKSIGMTYNDWVDYFTFERNYEKENKLFYDVLKLEDDEEFVLVNKNYQMRPEILSYNRINSDSSYYNKKVVEMSVFDEFTLFDWCKVIEKSKQIHTVDTSLILLIEKMDLVNTELYLYPRGSLSDVDYLLKKNWIKR
jgi:hypothetical protein